MHPNLITIGEWSVPAYPLLYGLGITLGSIVMLMFGARDGLNVRKLAHLTLLAALSIVAGGRVFYVCQYWEHFSRDPLSALNFAEGGQVLYGGLLLTIPTVLVFTRPLRLPLARTADLFAVGAPLGLAVGRWACFCRGCCFGKITDIAWAIRYPKHVDLDGNVVGPPAFISHAERGLLTDTADLSLPVHPGPVYASFVSLGVFSIMLWLWKNGRFSGRLVIVYSILYAVTRFGLEFTRENEMAFWGLTIPQVVSVFIVPLGLLVLAIPRPRLIPCHAPIRQR